MIKSKEILTTIFSNGAHFASNWKKPTLKAFSGVKNIRKVLKKCLPKNHELMKEDNLLKLEAVSTVFPFKTNNYVIEQLIDWNNVPNDPLFQLTFPQPGMLEPKNLDTIFKALKDHTMSPTELSQFVRKIRLEKNPHSAGQVELNIPTFEGEKIDGCQHKYQETALFFPSQGQYCQAYCTYCFRWPNLLSKPLVGEEGQVYKFQSSKCDKILDYLRTKPNVTDLLITGGDAGVLTAKNYETFFKRFLEGDVPHLTNIRIGTKSLSYWPYKWTTDKDAAGILKQFEKMNKAGRHIAFMAHFSHNVEMETPEVEKAIRNLKNVGCEIRCQSPCVAHVNDDPKVWETMWKEQVRRGMVPYYMFIERDTGAQRYFQVPLEKVYNIFYDAYKNCSGLCRTVRGPSGSIAAGKVGIQGIEEIAGQKVFILKFYQARNPDWLKKVFFAKYDPNATWYEQLEPAFTDEWFFDKEMKETYPEWKKIS